MLHTFHKYKKETPCLCRQVSSFKAQPCVLTEIVDCAAPCADYSLICREYDTTPRKSQQQIMLRYLIISPVLSSTIKTFLHFAQRYRQQVALTCDNLLASLRPQKGQTLASSIIIPPKIPIRLFFQFLLWCRVFRCSFQVYCTSGTHRNGPLIFLCTPV